MTTQGKDKRAVEERCETCRFGCRRVYIEPDPLPEPTSGSALFGLVRWHEPTDDQRALYDRELKLAESTRPCMRYPKIRRVRLDHWCGEYQVRQYLQEQNNVG